MMAASVAAEPAAAAATESGLDDPCGSGGSSSSSSKESRAVVVDATDCIDAFPTMYFHQQQWELLKSVLDSCLSMENMNVYKPSAIPVIPYKVEVEEPDGHIYHEISFYNLSEDRHLLSAQFDRLYTGACTRLPRTGFEGVSWSQIDRRLMRIPRVGHRKCNAEKINKTDGQCRKGNSDYRQSFVFRNQHLVKRHLTNGVRTTDIYDIYVIYKVPLLIYRLKKDLIFGGGNGGGGGGGLRSLPKDGTFYPCHERFFDAFLLKPLGEKYTIYVVQPKATYLTISLQMTCYSIIRASYSAYMQILPHYDIFDAFSPSLAFHPKSPEEVDRLVNSAAGDPKAAAPPKRKRGRPTKSLDMLYWYRDHLQQQLQREEDMHQPSPPGPTPVTMPPFMYLMKFSQPTASSSSSSSNDVMHQQNPPSAEQFPQYLDNAEYMLSIPSSMDVTIRQDGQQQQPQQQQQQQQPQQQQQQHETTTELEPVPKKLRSTHELSAATTLIAMEADENIEAWLQTNQKIDL